MAEHLELVAEIPKVEKLTVQERLEYAKKRRAQQLKRWEREEDTTFGPPPPKKKPFRAKPVSFQPSTILLEAATRGDIDEVKALLEGGMDPNLANDDGLTGLHQACIDGYEDMINLILEHGAKLDATDRELWTPLHAAAACGNADIVELLIEEGADIVALNSDGNMPIDIVGEEDEETREILEAEMEEQGYTEQKLEELRELVERRMLSEIKQTQAEDEELDLDKAVSDQGATLLHVAVANGYEEVTEFLLEHGASVDIVDKDGWEPIHGAAVWGNGPVIQMLVEAGADLEAKTPTGETPLTLCEDPELQQFIVDLKNKVKANKVKMGKRKRSNSRSLSVKRTSLKDKITISQNEAKAEAVLRVHPQLAFLIPTEEREKLAGAIKTEESKPMDVTPTTTTGTPTKNLTTNNDSRSQDEVVSHHVISSKPRTKESPVRTKESESPPKEKETPTRTRDRESPARVKDKEIREMGDGSLQRKKEKENIDPNKREIKTSVDAKIETKIKDNRASEISKEEGRKSDRISDIRIENNDRTADSRNIYSSTAQSKQPPSPRDPSPAVTPTKPAQMVNTHTNIGQRTESGGTSSLPRSTKSRHAPPPPLQHSSGSLSRNFEKSDTSGYPDSFSKRSRGSRENIVDVATSGRLARPDAQAASVSDVKVSAGTGNYKPSKPTNTSQPSSPAVTTGQRSAGSGTGQRPAGSGTGQRPAGSGTGQRSTSEGLRQDGNKNNASGLANERIHVRDDVKVDREKKSCCVLM